MADENTNQPKGEIHEDELKTMGKGDEGAE